MLYVSILINVRNCLEEVFDWLSFQVSRTYISLLVLLQCSYHYGISHENRTSISRRCEQVPFLYEVSIGLEIGICLVSILVSNIFNDPFPLSDEIKNIYIPPDALESLRQSCEFVCPNDGFLDQVMQQNSLSHGWRDFMCVHYHKSMLFFFPYQLKMFEEMGFKVDHASPIYKRFRLKVLGKPPLLFFA